MSTKSNLLYLAYEMQHDDFVKKNVHRFKTFNLLDQMTELNLNKYLIHLDLIIDEEAFWTDKYSQMELEPSNIIIFNAFKYFILDSNLEAMKNQLKFEKIVYSEQEVYVDKNLNLRIEAGNQSTKYYNNGNLKITVDHTPDGDFISHEIRNDFYIYGSTHQFMFAAIQHIIETTSEFNYVLNEYHTYLPQFIKWKYTNYKQLYKVKQNIYKNEAQTEYTNFWVKELFENKHAIQPFTHRQKLISQHKKILFVAFNSDILTNNQRRAWLKLFDQETFKPVSSLPKQNIITRTYDHLVKGVYQIDNTDLATFNPTKQKVILRANTDNLLTEARQNSNIRAMITKLIKNDYVLTDGIANEFTFIKRAAYLTKLASNLSAGQFLENDIFWSEQVIGKPKNMLVIFSSLPTNDKYFSSDFLERAFTQNNPQIYKFIKDDVVIVRIADLNAIYGSYYTNTVNYPNYENNIAKALESIQNKYHLTNNNVTLYGSSKGGYGALLSSLNSGYNAILMDPIVSMKVYNKNLNLHYMQGIEVVNRFEHVKQLLSNIGDNKIYILISSTGNYQTRENAHLINKLYDCNNKLKVIDLTIDYVIDHPTVTTKTLNIQNTILNKYLLTQE